jgi:hypothetical protein
LSAEYVIPLPRKLHTRHVRIVNDFPAVLGVWKAGQQIA